MSRTSPRLLLVAIAVLVTAFSVWLALQKKKGRRVEVQQPPTASPAAVDDRAGLTSADREMIQGGHPLAAELNARDHPPQRDLEILREMLLSFTTSLKLANLPPLGDNQDITAALTGKNRKKLVLIPPSHPSVDEKGRLLDRWGTPYHFHARSAESFDLRSAGPDRKLFTADDVIWSPPAARHPAAR